MMYSMCFPGMFCSPFLLVVPEQKIQWDLSLDRHMTFNGKDINIVKTKATYGIVIIMRHEYCKRISCSMED